MTAPNSAARSLRPATQLIHGGRDRSQFQETSEPIYLTQSYIYDSAEQAEATFNGEVDRFIYSRYGNPTVQTFQEKLRILEGAQACVATATGMSAVFTSLAALVQQGSRIVAARALFGSSLVIFDEIFAKWGVKTDYVDGHVLSDWQEALATPADVVFFETPSNPMQDIIDVRAVSNLAHEAGATVVVDNVFATPICQRPLELGADIVVYSATKHIDGQGRVLGGAILGPAEYINGPVQTFIRNTGPSLSPFNAWVLLKGLETLPVRVAAQTASALQIAKTLEVLPGIGAVRYPFLESHGQYELAKSQQSGGGTVVTFDLALPEGVSPEEEKQIAFKFLNGLELVAISNNLGDAKSLITHPATTTHRRLGLAGRAKVGMRESTVRLSVGLEDAQDILDDIEIALHAAAAK